MLKQKTPRAKGKQLEKDTAELYRKTGIDPFAKPMPGSGSFVFKGDIAKPQDSGWVDECKNDEKMSVWQAWLQAASQAIGLQKPVLHIKKDGHETLTVMRQKDYFQLRQELKELSE